MGHRDEVGTNESKSSSSKDVEEEKRGLLMGPVLPYLCQC